ncbi:hypothetical protein [Capnocytophaga sp.]|uniref:hypothetical protein n=1 Tax=Capnocytophaga sp. TaxID=44737 RepID=UPI0026DDA43A|nr:hypothetical protein [Capnocytophaga sp.]MDO5106593.1 hypothetical protein [Capnocytophaga sp.]
MILTLLFCVVGSALYAQNQELYVGPGIGFDYGGIGGKIEYLPVKNFGVFGGLGFNFLTVGWNVGATYKIPVSRMVSVNPIAMFGYNGVNVTFGKFPEYEKVSYGPSFGANVDIKFGKRGNKLSAGLLIPVRSKAFNDVYKAMEKDSRLITTQLFPVAVSVGYNFKLK